MSNILNKQVIFDLGVNNGNDTAFYLEKGFRVIGVEANPLLADAARERFAEEINQGRLVLLNVGIWHTNATMPFYVNESNDHWSSFDPGYGCRQGTPFHIIEVQCLTISQLLESYELPYYMKIDIEGADKVVIAQMQELTGRPHYISVEEYGVKAIDDLHQLGYGQFAIVPQRTKTVASAPETPLEGEGAYLARQFDDTVSGVFGRELQDPWRSYEEARQYYLNSIRREDHTYIGPQYEWYDIHAQL